MQLADRVPYAPLMLAGLTMIGTLVVTAATPSPADGSRSVPRGDFVCERPELPARLTAHEVGISARRHIAGAKQCYVRALRAHQLSDLDRSTRVMLSIHGDGSVGSVALDRSEYDRFDDCVVAEARSWTFRATSRDSSFSFTLELATE